MGAECFAQPLEIDLVRCRQHRHHIFAVDIQNHGLGQFLPRDMRRSGDLLRGIGRRMNDAHILDVMLVQKRFQFFDRHGGLLSVS